MNIEVILLRALQFSKDTNEVNFTNCCFFENSISISFGVFCFGFFFFKAPYKDTSF